MRNTTTARRPMRTTACSLRSGRAFRTCAFGMLGLSLGGQAFQPAWAQSSAAIQTFIKQANAACEINGYREIYHGVLQGSGQRTTVATFSVEGCGGGNNGASTFGIYSEGGGTVHEWKQTPGPEGPVRAVAVVAGRVSVQWMSWKPSDPHCCPSIAHRTIYILRDGLAVAGK